MHVPETFISLANEEVSLTMLAISRLRGTNEFMCPESYEFKGDSREISSTTGRKHSSP